MSNVSEWSVSAGSNNASPPNGWPEGMQRSAVNDAAREMMAALAKWYQDQRGSLVTGGGTTVYTLATNNVHTSYSDVPLMLIRANVANTGATTLNIDGLGAKNLTLSDGTAVPAGIFTTGKLYVIAYNTPADRLELLGLSSGEFASGTTAVFAQTSAPTGWTKGATHNDKALRVVTGTASSGGSTAFTSVFASRTLLQANLPLVNFNANALVAAAHTHTFSATTNVTGAHTHTYTSPRNDHNTSITGGQATSDAGTGATTGSNGDHSHTVSGTTDSTGSISVTGTVSSGGSGTPVDFAVQYVDVILATKN